MKLYKEDIVYVCRSFGGIKPEILSCEKNNQIIITPMILELNYIRYWYHS